MWRTLTSTSNGQWLRVGAVAFTLLTCILPAQVSEADFQQLREQNRRLEEQVKKQQELIDRLHTRFTELQQKLGEPPEPGKSAPPPDEHKGRFLEMFHLGGEIGFGVFHTGNQGAFPKSPFRVDQAKLFLEASIWENVYLHTELDLFIRETDTEFFRLGEVYLDAEDVSLLWGRERQMSLRVGRFYIPFGEEYAVRNVMSNPLVSHSLADFWGVDEGVEIYGALGKFDYALAVQNGGHPQLNDFNADKSVAARVGFNATPWLRVSASAMRTGRLDARGDFLSEMWFGNGFFRSIGSASTTTFAVDLAELDAQAKWRSGHVKVFGGGARYDDNDPLADNRRNAWFWSAEGMQNLLSFSRQHAPERRLIKVNELVEAVIELLAYDLRTSNIQVAAQFPPDLPAILGDPHQLQQVFFNIVNNARQAIEAHRPSGAIRVRALAAGAKVRLEFEDDGPGIAPENLSRVFDPFFTTKPVGKGTGLGLSICYGIIKEHGGTISACSEPGKGNMFVIELPAANEAAVPVREGAGPAGAPAIRVGTGRRVLVVNDEPDILRLVSAILKSDGYAVDAVSDGEAALSSIARERYEVIVSDWKMPGCNGMVILERLQKTDPRSAARLMFMTGDVISETFPSFLATHRKTCLNKLFTLHEFRAAVAAAAPPNNGGVSG